MTEKKKESIDSLEGIKFNWRRIHIRRGRPRAKLSKEAAALVKEYNRVKKEREEAKCNKKEK